MPFRSRRPIALQRGLRVVEIPIVLVDRRAGRSKMAYGDVFEAVVGVLRMRYASRLPRP